MPTTITETDAFQQTLQRPNNGELADAASLLLFMQPAANRERYVYNRTRGNLYDARRAPFNANPSAGSDATSAIQAAIDAANADGGGDVWLIGSFIYSLLTMKSGVSLRGMPDLTYLYSTHTTNPLLSFANAQPKNAVEVSGINFGATVNNSGDFMSFAAASKVKFRNCTWLDTALKGKVVNAAQAVDLEFDGCNIALQSAVQGIGNAGRTVIRGGRIAMPATFSNNVLVGENQNGVYELDGVFFDASARGGGDTGYCVWARVGSTVRVVNCRFAGTTSVVTNAFGFASGGTLRAEGNQFDDKITVYTGSSSSALSFGSKFDLAAVYPVDASATPLTLPEGYEFTNVNITLTSTLTIVAPKGAYHGQRWRLVLRNGTVVTLQPVFGTTLITAHTVPTIPAGDTCSCDFVFTRGTDGNNRWVQISDWVVAAPLV